eukprot:TRINITY_DN6898_c0_g1_i1.p1 TRINITY_DN6898_c0_g1~~TRINITY_DN6898_c0_g1_i1.p1  ORF type:complete len:433 (-),score=81.71 TRINITY_DN6898_c0_g1_i1:157-1455(-)
MGGFSLRLCLLCFTNTFLVTVVILGGRGSSLGNLYASSALRRASPLGFVQPMVRTTPRMHNPQPGQRTAQPEFAIPHTGRDQAGRSQQTAGGLLPVLTAVAVSVACFAFTGTATAEPASSLMAPVALLSPPSETTSRALLRKRRRGPAAKIQWYPGHIARAEKQLKRQIELVDVVLEMRDARIPLATSHPHLEKWTLARPRVLVLNRRDQISHSSRKAWDAYFREIGEVPYWCNANTGDGVVAILDAASKYAGAANEKRALRGLRPRPARALVLGFPNVGKSALINRLAGRRAVVSAGKPGVTTALQWVKASPSLEVLDSPGLVPPRMNDDQAATLLAQCDDIGTAAYDNQDVAIQLVERLQQLPSKWGSQSPKSALERRYGVNPTLPAWDFLEAASWRHTGGQVEAMAVRLLTDFRRGFLGNVCLQTPPVL